MQEVLAPWAAWYGEAPLKMEFPEHWDISVHNMRGGRDIGDSGIRTALAQAIGAPELSEYALGKKTAAKLLNEYGNIEVILKNIDNMDPGNVLSLKKSFNPCPYKNTSEWVKLLN